MKRGEIRTLQADGYASKPRPVVIVQSDAVDRFDSVITCLLTSYDSSDIDTRVRLEPSPENGLNKVSYVMTDKIVTVGEYRPSAHAGSRFAVTFGMAGGRASTCDIVYAPLRPYDDGVEFKLSPTSKKWLPSYYGHTTNTI